MNSLIYNHSNRCFSFEEVRHCLNSLRFLRESGRMDKSGQRLYQRILNQVASFRALALEKHIDKKFPKPVYIYVGDDEWEEVKSCD